MNHNNDTPVFVYDASYDSIPTSLSLEQSKHPHQLQQQQQQQRYNNNYCCKSIDNDFDETSPATDNTSNAISDGIERLEIMFRQENELYHVSSTTPPSQQSSSSSSSFLSPQGGGDDVIDIVDCRNKMASWCYDLIRFCQMNYETAELAMSCLDRFMWNGLCCCCSGNDGGGIGVSSTTPTDDNNIDIDDDEFDDDNIINVNNNNNTKHYHSHSNGLSKPKQQQQKQQQQQRCKEDKCAKNRAWSCHETIDVECGESIEVYDSSIIASSLRSTKANKGTTNDKAASTTSVVSLLDQKKYQGHRLVWTDKGMYQLAAMTSLYTAIKIQEAAAFNPEIVSTKLSHGTYTPYQIEQMEIIMLDTLQWRMNPPTIGCFVHEFMNIYVIPVLLQSDDSCAILLHPPTLDVFNYLILQQIQNSVIDYKMVTIHSYIKAYCVIINSLEILKVNTNTLQKVDVMLRTIVMKSYFSSTPYTTTMNFVMQDSNTINNTISPNHPNSTDNTKQSNQTMDMDSDDDGYQMMLRFCSWVYEIRSNLYGKVMEHYNFPSSLPTSSTSSLLPTSSSSPPTPEPHSPTTSTATTTAGTTTAMENHDPNEATHNTSTITTAKHNKDHQHNEAISIPTFPLSRSTNVTMQ